MTKQDAELAFWKDEMTARLPWFRGEVRERYGTRCPLPHERFTCHGTEELNALYTFWWFERYRYCHHLHVEPTYFRGHALEIGCGPLSAAPFFPLISMYVGIDPLVKDYYSIGYPKLYHAIQCPAERINIADASFDCVFSVNAVDHTDSFEETISEIERVTKLDGEIRIECHYHKATVTEPVELNDDRVLAAFRKFKMQVVKRSTSVELGYPPGTHPASDSFVVWSNKPHYFNAIKALHP